MAATAPPELVSCAYGASLDVVFIPPEVLGRERGVALAHTAVHRAATLPAPAAPRQPQAATRAQTEPGVAPVRPLSPVRKLTARLRRRSSAARPLPPVAEQARVVGV
ncbi:hypothetical protein PsYK624_010010 [Phanerochaete sordida]|uniref:Uncharacterized protein n=1 Tax=Phanerochaete sordida TaxID=48140 RepID=A0A9P3L7G3_9APHY|nr:hypothetical protein PsYK624_010010 [Phanerochaete sordida]